MPWPARYAARSPKPQPASRASCRVLIPQGPALYISLLAILKAGGAFCPLNLDAPPERISFILGDVAATVVLSTPELGRQHPEFQCRHSDSR